MKKIIIGCDNAGVEMKQAIIRVLCEEGIEYEDIGVYSAADGTMYPDVAAELCQRIIASGYQTEGILVCGTGIGMAITANKFPGIYAAVCHDIYSAERARLSNDTNVMTLGARVVGIELAKQLARHWLRLAFAPGASSPKLQRIRELENKTILHNNIQDKCT
jgi:ribose 5-phosphate isomerase B